MAKVITQQTFDDVVKENVKEFEMSTEDAIQDAVQQFESQVILPKQLFVPQFCLFRAPKHFQK